MTIRDTELTRNFYDRISAAYDLIADSGEYAARESGLKALDVQAGEHVLEIGYGLDLNSQRTIRRVQPAVDGPPQVQLSPTL